MYYKKIWDLLKIKDKLYKLTKKYPSSEIIKDEFRIIRNKCSNIINSQKRKFYQKKISKNYDNRQKLWEYMNEALYNRDSRLKCLILLETIIWQN